jgi:hypothetical protein
MKAKEMRIARGASPFITKADASPIPSPITKVHTSRFIMKARTCPILNIERRMLQRHVSVLYAPYKAHSQLGQNSDGAQSGMFLSCSYCFFPFLEVPSKTLVAMN